MMAHEELTEPETFIPLQSGLLGDLAMIRHGVTKRVAAAGQGEANIGYGAPHDRHDAWESRQRWADTVGVDPETIVTCSQVHGATVLRIDEDHIGQGARPGSGSAGRGDALMTDRPGVALLTLHADCAPILLVDPVRPAVATVHAGWRGTVSDVAGTTVVQMRHHFGSNPEHIKAFIGPAIGPCCYEVGPEVMSAWREQAGVDAPAALVGYRHFDLATANHWLLRRAKLDERNIEHSQICTRCQQREWFSHRAQGPLTGRFGATIAIRSPRTSGGK